MSFTDGEWNNPIGVWPGPAFIPLQTSCGTIDVENVWYQAGQLRSNAPVEVIVLRLNDREQGPLIPLTRESGIFQLIGLAERPEP